MAESVSNLSFEERARRAFGRVLVERSDDRAVRLGGQLPAFLAEYLVAAYGLDEAGRLVAEHWPTARLLSGMKYQLLTDGSLDILDHLEAFVDLDQGLTRARLTAFQHVLPIGREILDRYPDLLSGGMWGRVSLSTRGSNPDILWFSPPSSIEDSEEAPETVEEFAPVLGDAVIAGFEPCQVSVEIHSLVNARHQFSTEEWIDLLLASAGYNPEWIRAQSGGRRLTRLYLLRLIPLVERNLNLMELGPKNTGKTHLLRNLSPYAYTVAGGQATPANLFVNLTTQAAGLIQSRRVILFDEVARVEFSRNQATLSLMKDYMESGQFSRGRDSYGADTSIVFMGNLDVEGQRPSARYRHLFQVLPASLQDTAVLDRLHTFIPGWELPKLTPDALKVRFALATDYFGEALLLLRDWPYDAVWSEVQRRWPLVSGLTRRDAVALDRVGRALFKLVFPDGNIDDRVAVELLSIAAEGRQRIHEQLVKMEPGEFLSYPIGFHGAVAVSTPDALTVETSQDYTINRKPRAGEATGAAGGDTADAVIVEVVKSGDNRRQPTVLVSEGIAGTDAVWQLVRVYLQANLARLGLQQRAQWEGLGVQFSGGPGDVRGRAELATVLAVVSAWIAVPLKPAMAAIGGLTLAGDVTAPPDMLALVMAVLNRGRRTIIVPQSSNLELLKETFLAQFSDLRLVPVPSVAETLKWAFQ